MSGPVRPYVADFGLARDVGTGQPGPSPSLTRTGELLGTPGYLSPEQIKADPRGLSPASDVWGLGCVLYEMLAARPAFPGEGTAAILGAVMTARPAAVAGVPPAVARLVDRCLQRAPRARPANGAVLAAECRLALRGRSVAGAGRVRSAAAVGALVCVAAVLGVAWWARGPVPATPTGARHDASQQLAAQGWANRAADPGAGAEQLAAALARDPGREEWRLQLALLRWAAGDMPGARTALDLLAPAGPLATRAAWLRGLIEASAALSATDPSPVEARRCWTAAAEGRGDEAGLALAGLLLLDDQLDAARERLRGRAGWEAALLRGLVESHAGNRRGDGAARGAERAYSEALADGPALAWAHVNRGHAREELGDEAGAMADFEIAVRLAPRWHRGWHNHARARSRRGDAPGALADLDRALALEPTSADALVLRGTVHEHLGDAESAAADYDAALAVDPRHTTGLFNRGGLRRDRGDPTGASRDFDACLTVAPAHPQARLARAELRNVAGDVDGAFEDYSAALAAAPDYLKAWNARGLAYMARGGARERAGDREGAAEARRAAERDFTAAMEIDPGYAIARVNRAGVRLDLDDLDGAVTDLEAALAIDAARPEAWATLGTARWRLGDLGEALAAFQRALAVAPVDWPHGATVQQYVADVSRALAEVPPIRDR